MARATLSVVPATATAPVTAPAIAPRPRPAKPTNVAPTTPAMAPATAPRPRPSKPVSTTMVLLDVNDRRAAVADVPPEQQGAFREKMSSRGVWCLPVDAAPSLIGGLCRLPLTSSGTVRLIPRCGATWDGLMEAARATDKAGFAAFVAGQESAAAAPVPAPPAKATQAPANEIIHDVPPERAPTKVKTAPAPEPAPESVKAPSLAQGIALAALSSLSQEEREEIFAYFQ